MKVVTTESAHWPTAQGNYWEDGLRYVPKGCVGELITAQNDDVLVYFFSNSLEAVVDKHYLRVVNDCEEWPEDCFMQSISLN